jgi:hypothetical protein
VRGEPLLSARCRGGVRTLAAIGATLTALVAAAPAAAKELTKAELCGPAGCAVVTDRAQLRMVPDSEITTGPPPVTPYHELRVTVEHEGESDTWTIYYIASSNLTVAPGDGGSMTYHRVFGRSTTFMRRLASRVEPFPAPELTGVAVGGKRVKLDPSTALGLLAARRPAAYPADADWVPITLTTRARTPWTNVSLTYAPGPDVLLRGDEFVELDGELAAPLDSAAGIEAPGRSLLPWLLLAALGAALAVLAGLGALLRRRAALALTVLIALAAVPIAQAKGRQTSLELCGREACVTIRDDRVITGLMPYGRATVSPPPLSPYYAIGPRVRYDGLVYYVPGAGMVATSRLEPTLGGSRYVVWLPVNARARRLVDEYASRLEPFPALRITQVRIGDRLVTGSSAASYARLLEATFDEAAAPPAVHDWLAIDLRSDRPTPWTAERAEFLYSPGANLLDRGLSIIRVPDSLAADLEAGRALGDHGRPLLPWLLLTALVALIGLLAALAAAVRRLADQRVLASRTA